MAKPSREIMVQSREIYCRYFKDKIIYEIPTTSGLENAFGRAIHLEVSLNQRPPKYDPVIFKEPITLLTKSLFKENYKTNIVLEELPTETPEKIEECMR